MSLAASENTFNRVNVKFSLNVKRLHMLLRNWNYENAFPSMIKDYFTIFFKLLFGRLTANFGPLSRGQSHSLYVNHCVFPFRSEGHRVPRNEVGSLSRAPSGFKTETFRFLLQRLNPLDHSPQKTLSALMLAYKFT